MKKPKFSYFSCDSTPRSSPGVSPSIKNAKKQLLNQSRLSKLQAPNPSSLLFKVSNRSKAPSDANISAETAASVVKNYILPMFEQEIRQKQELKRQSFHTRRFSIESSTVYGELKLSEKLLKENHDLHDSISLMEKTMKEHSQSFEVMRKENEICKKKEEDNLINNEFLLFENQKLRVEVNRMTFALTYAANQYRRYKILCDRLKEENQNYASELHKMHELNDIR
jgi:hypothetical protein